MARAWNRNCSGWISPAARNTGAFRPISGESPPRENELRGGLSPPVERLHRGSSRGPGFGGQARLRLAGGNPPNEDPLCCRFDHFQPGQRLLRGACFQGRSVGRLGSCHQGIPERGMQRIVERGGGGDEYPPTGWSELET